MKIAVYYNLTYGGAKRTVQAQVKGLKNLQHYVDVYTQDKNRDEFSPGIFADKEYTYEYFPRKIRLPIISRVLEDLQVFFQLKNLHKKIAEDIDSRGYDIVIVHTDTLTQAPFILRFLKTRNVYFCLEPLRIAYEYSLKTKDALGIFNKFYEAINRMIRKKIDQDNARSAMFTLAISLFGREYMIHAFDLYPKISYLGVDQKFFKPLKRKKKNQVLFVAEKEYIYGYDLAEVAIKLIPEHSRPILKVVFGTKKDQRISDEELVKMYNDSLVTLSLSRFDTFGLVPLESMACGTPVIALNVAGYRETIINGKTGFNVDFDPQEIAEKISLFMDNPLLSEKMGKEGRKWIEDKWTWKYQIKILDNLLHEFTAKEL
ncbi:MAG: glycosyltransferase family 4 protein [Candidatus Parcubacteria bacterium]|nr:glycosyltransferase family 4 protein [Candidatus Parcubacteria bacterium]